VGTACAAAADEHGNSNRRRLEGGEHAAFELGTGNGHEAVTDS